MPTRNLGRASMTRIHAGVFYRIAGIAGIAGSFFVVLGQSGRSGPRCIFINRAPQAFLPISFSARDRARLAIQGDHRYLANSEWQLILILNPLEFIKNLIQIRIPELIILLLLQRHRLRREYFFFDQQLRIQQQSGRIRRPHVFPPSTLRRGLSQQGERGRPPELFWGVLERDPLRSLIILVYLWSQYRSRRIWRLYKFPPSALG
ncbi:hypothetical protein GGR50DRAFT_575953 [Xylaria sp. CBS 124048]|nr:hypothetical protein GGR50DRAFT_575953 [Xylaria sp. CBS 124048]